VGFFAYFSMAINQANTPSKGFQSDSSGDQVFDLPFVKFEDLKITKKELSSMENLLPHGLFLDGERLQSFSFQPYTAKFDRILGQLYKKSRGRIIPVVSNFLPEIVKDINGIAIAEIAKRKNTSPIRLFESMVLGDILTLILFLRFHVLGEERDDQTICPIALKAQCPNCGSNNDDKPEIGEVHDLGTVEVPIIENLSDKLLIEVELQDGIRSFDDHIKHIYMQPLRFYQAETIAKSERDAEDIVMLYQCVKAIPEASAYANTRGQVFGEELYDQLTMKDLNILRDAIKNVQIQPDMSLAFKCWNCSHEWDVSLEWGRLREFLSLPNESNL
jgi:hypothetical protein